MAEVSIASVSVDQVSGSLSDIQDATLAHKNKIGTYTSDGTGMTVTLGINEGYSNVTTTSGGAITLNLPDVAEAAGRQYSVNFTKDTTNLTVVYTGTGTANLAVSSSALKIFKSDGVNWLVVQ